MGTSLVISTTEMSNTMGPSLDLVLGSNNSPSISGSTDIIKAILCTMVFCLIIARLYIPYFLLIWHCVTWVIPSVGQDYNSRNQYDPKLGNDDWLPKNE